MCKQSRNLRFCVSNVHMIDGYVASHSENDKFTTFDLIKERP